MQPCKSHRRGGEHSDGADEHKQRPALGARLPTEAVRDQGGDDAGAKVATLV
ncbi:MAG: hypothetical protein ACRD9W_22940 [Terriglobia bacterium]